MQPPAHACYCRECDAAAARLEGTEAVVYSIEKSPFASKPAPRKLTLDEVNKNIKISHAFMQLRWLRKDQR